MLELLSASDVKRIWALASDSMIPQVMKYPLLRFETICQSNSEISVRNCFTLDWTSLTRGAAFHLLYVGLTSLLSLRYNNTQLLYVKWLILRPIELLATQLRADIFDGRTQNDFQLVRDRFNVIRTREGFLAFFRAVPIQFVTCIVQSLYFKLSPPLVISGLQCIIANNNSKPLLRIYMSTLTFLGVVVCYPIDTVARRMMLDVGKKQKRYTSTVDCIRKIYRHEGLWGFYNGIQLSVIYLTIQTIIKGLPTLKWDSGAKKRLIQQQQQQLNDEPYIEITPEFKRKLTTIAQNLFS